jgi:hypothetical protein
MLDEVLQNERSVDAQELSSLVNPAKCDRRKTQVADQLDDTLLDFLAIAAHEHDATSAAFARVLGQ